ncbi:hypothetical protein E4T47_05850 [Aureobasidium subglaciale]|nr:hypothetical protein E4T47_05850 [Aureobasidium subglaciale]
MVVEDHDKCIWRWWVTTDIIGSSHAMIQIQSQGDNTSKVYRATVHKELLCFHSTYYAAAMKGQFPEYSLELFTLDLSHEQLWLFVAWLYSGRVEDHLGDSLIEDDIYALYVFADQTNIIALRRSIMVLLGTSRDMRVPHFLGHLAKFLRQLTDSCGLRKFLFDEALAVWTDGDLESCDEDIWVYKMYGHLPDEYPEDFYVQLIEANLEAMTNKRDDYKFSCFKNPCDYHEHVDEEEWNNSKIN